MDTQTKTLIQKFKKRLVEIRTLLSLGSLAKVKQIEDSNDDSDIKYTSASFQMALAEATEEHRLNEIGTVYDIDEETMSSARECFKWANALRYEAEQILMRAHDHNHAGFESIMKKYPHLREGSFTIFGEQNKVIIVA
mgnify:CR=1 FL=1